ncbi:MAG: GDSL-type esterase/lipase family protein [Nitrososphaeraceae archaeon]|nr:GDSL-type esterase/lipase family protein [Nitrososphaeraceae archaeon]
MKKIVLASILFLSLFCILSGCVDDIEENINPEPEIVEEGIKFLALGDSYTAGAGIDSIGSWPVQLVNRIKKDSIIVDTLAVIAKTDQATSNLLNAIERTELIDFNLVSLQIGVNNQFRGSDFSIFETEFNALLDTAFNITGSNEQIFVLSIPDYGVTPFGAENAETIASEIDIYNNYIQEQCELRNILFINVTDISRELGDGSLALAPDKLHPSAYQYGEWVKIIFPEVLQLVDQMKNTP